MRKKPRYTKEFKIEAVNLVIEQGYRVPEAARNRGMSESALRRWVHLHQKDNVESPMKLEDMTTVQVENKALKKQVKRLKMAREILKKAAAFFVNESV